jgi:hypothetical protein
LHGLRIHHPAARNPDARPPLPRHVRNSQSSLAGSLVARSLAEARHLNPQAAASPTLAALCEALIGRVPGSATRWRRATDPSARSLISLLHGGLGPTEYSTGTMYGTVCFGLARAELCMGTAFASDRYRGIHVHSFSCGMRWDLQQLRDLRKMLFQKTQLDPPRNPESHSVGLSDPDNGLLGRHELAEHSILQQLNPQRGQPEQAN